MAKIKAFVCILLLFVRCVFDYSEYDNRSDAARQSPSIQILGIKYHDIEYNKEQIALESSSFNYYNYYKIFKLENGRFLFNVLNKKISGKFYYLEGSHVTKDLDMKDFVEFGIENKDDYYLVNTNRLLWKDKDKKLYSTPNEPVLIRFNNSEIKGKGFSYFLNSNIFYFDSGIEGIIN